MREDVEAGELGHQQGDVVVVVAVPPERDEEVVAERVQALGAVGERRGQPVQALVDVRVARLDETVGVEEQPGAVRHLDGGRLEGHATDPQRHARRLGEQLGRPVRGAQDRRRVPGSRERQRAPDRVEHGVHAGGELHLVGPLGEVVEVAQDVLRHRVEDREHPDGGAQLAHRRCRPQPAAHHVADDEGDPAAGERDDVEPVTADAEVAAAGEVAVRGVDAGDQWLHAGQQGALQGDRGRPRLVVQADVVEGEGGPGRDLLGEGDVHGGVRRAARGPGQPHHSEDPAARPQRHEEPARAGRPFTLAARDPAAQGNGRRAAGRVGDPLVAAQQGFRVGDVDAGDAEQDRAVRHRPALGVEEALDQVDVGDVGQHRHQAAGQPTGDGAQVQAAGQVRAGLDEEPEPCLGRDGGVGPGCPSCSVTPSTLPPSPEAGDQVGSVPVPAIQASCRTMCSCARAQMGHRRERRRRLLVWPTSRPGRCPALGTG